jgi:hypothetical protein
LGLNRDSVSKGVKSGGGGKFTPWISWKPGDKKALFFVTPIAEVPKIRVHNFVEIPTEDGSRWGTFMCRKDPSWLEESGGFCKLCDEIGHKADFKYIALAVELDVVRDGKKVVSVKPMMKEVTREDGSTAEYPQVGLVLQSGRLFFNYLGGMNEQLGDVNDFSWEILRQGKGTDTSYTFVYHDIKPDLSEIQEMIPDLYDRLDEMGSKTTYETELANVEPGSQRTWGDSDNTSKQAEVTPEEQGNFDALKAELETRKTADVSA